MLQLAFGEGGVLNGTLRTRQNAASPRALGILLDGTFFGTAPLGPWRGGAHAFRIDLPHALVFGELDLLRLPEGDSLLREPYPLAPGYALRLADPVLDGPVIRGRFEAAAFLADRIGVEFLDGSHVAARGVAERRPGNAAWHFAAPLSSLPPPGRTVVLRPRIGGHVLAAGALPVSAEAIGLAGCLDVASPDSLQGWAARRGADAAPLRLDVLVDGARVATVEAGDLRPDIASLGFGARAGFSAALPTAANPAAPRQLAVRLAGTITHLAGSPVTVTRETRLVGSFDSLHGLAAHGWALDHADPSRPVEVEARGPDGAVLGRARAERFRGDLLDAGLNRGLCAFKIDLAHVAEKLEGQEITLRVAGTDFLLPGSPKRLDPNPNLLRFLRREQRLTAPVRARLCRALTHRAGTLGLSIVMPVHDTPRAWLVEAIESVRAQYCGNWELLCVNDGSAAPHIAPLLREYAATEPRIRVLTSRENVGIARAVNFGLRAARHDYVAFLDHDDTLEPDAVWQMLRAARETKSDLLYSDEALTDADIGTITDIKLRPAFSRDFYWSHPYFVHLVAVRTELARAIGGWDESLAISADVDFILRATEHASRVTHVPAVLYRWRTHGGSTGHAKQAEVMAATRGALQRHHDRLGTGARVRDGVRFNQFRLDWPDDDGTVLAVIPTKNRVDLLRTAVTSIERHLAGEKLRLVVIDHQSDDPETVAYLREIATRHIVMPYEGPFNFSRMNNEAVAKHGRGAAYVLFLNNDIEATQDGWIGRLRSLARRNEVGAVGPLLMYGDRHVQHAGVILGFNGSADHALKFQPVYADAAGTRTLGLNCSLTSVRDFSALTAACLMMRKSVFDEIGGFDESFAIGFNDTDLCLRIRARGYKLLYDGATLLYHYESATRSHTKQVFHPEDTARMTSRWGEALAGGDPWYHPNLAVTTQDHVLREDAGCRILHAPRTVALAASPPAHARGRKPAKRGALPRGTGPM